MWRPIILLTLIAYEVQSARILGVFPIPSKSHQVVFRSLTQELAKRGHELVIISPDPIPKEDQPYNVTDIDVSFVYENIGKEMIKSSSIFKRGVIQNIDVFIEYDLYLVFLNVVVEQMQSPQVQKLLTDKTQKFDLAEGFYEYHLIVSEIFKAPVISFASFMGFAEHYEMLGAIGRHPILYPNLHRMDLGDLGVWRMLKELYYEIAMYFMMLRVEANQDRLLKENFGPNAPTTEQLKKNVDMLFLNANPMMANNRPIPPNIQYLGAVHMQPINEIPKDLKTYLDNSKRGVVYVSFGSNVRPSLMEESLLNSLLQAFEALPFDVLWRFDGDNLKNVPKNVKVQKWFPQRDLLFHPNIKVFVTQCGLQSMDEAIEAGVPLVGVPMMAEQWYNAQKFVDFGIGVKLDSLTLTSKDLVEGVMTVAGNKSYKENIKRLKSIFYDQPQTPLEKAVWWTEYVIRQGGAKHLRSPIADMPWTQYYMLNVVFTISGVVSLVILSVVLLLRRLFSQKSNGGNKLKRN